jgi:hypothetical protein
MRFEAFTAVTMKNAVLWDVSPRGSYKNRRFGGTHRLHHHGDKSRRARNNVNSVLRFLVTVNIVPNSPILVSLMMEAIRSSETSVLTRSIRPNTPVEGIL